MAAPAAELTLFAPAQEKRREARLPPLLRGWESENMPQRRKYFCLEQENSRSVGTFVDPCLHCAVTVLRLATPPVQSG
jgi:hypothetical protein